MGYAQGANQGDYRSVIENLKELEKQGKLDKKIVLWGIGSQTKDMVSWLKKYGYEEQTVCIIDNFKYVFYQEYAGIPVKEPNVLAGMEKKSFLVLLAMNYAADVCRQLEACGVTEVYNLRNLQERFVPYHCELPYHFIDRSKGKRYLCYILAGYEPALYANTLGRIEAFQDERADYCLVSSGKYDEALNEISERNEWSYLYTEENQVCFIQNLVIGFHPSAEYILKMDEDIFIGRGFFGQMIQGYHKIEGEGEYRIGFMVPVVPLNCCGYAS